LIILGIKMRKTLIFCVVIIALLDIQVAFAVEGNHNRKSVESVMKTIARELFQSIEEKRTVSEHIKAKFSKPKAVALRTFKDNYISVRSSLIENWNQILQSELIRQSPTYLRFVAREDLVHLIDDELNTNFKARQGDVVGQILAKAQANVLIVGKVIPADGGVMLSYRVVTKEGSMLGLSKSHFLPVKKSDGSGKNKKSLNFDGALELAVTKLSEVGESLQKIRLGGFLESKQKIQTDFGRLMLKRLSDGLQDKLSNSVTGFFIPVDEASLAAKDIKQLKRRGLKVQLKKNVPSLLAGSERGSYILNGEYWDFGKYIQVRVTLRNSKGAGSSWNGNINRKSVPPKLLNLPKRSLWNGSNDLGTGPLGLVLESTRGRNPVFKVGDTMELLISTSESSHLNCFYNNAEGVVIKIFPNNGHKNDRIPGGSLVRIPNEEMPFKFIMSAPIGNEQIKCFATDQNVSQRLPVEIGQWNLRPIPSNIVNKLGEIYNELSGVRLSQATMNITVENKELSANH
jgi:hypothetical protein